VILLGIVAISYDRKFLGSIAHDQMLKVWISLSLSFYIYIYIYMVVCITCVRMKMARKGIKFIGYCIIGNSYREAVSLSISNTRRGMVT
jgi:hypothetical protein